MRDNYINCYRFRDVFVEKSDEPVFGEKPDSGLLFDLPEPGNRMLGWEKVFLYVSIRFLMNGEVEKGGVNGGEREQCDKSVIEQKSV